MRTASSQSHSANWVISIVLATLMTAAGYTVLRAVILLNDLSSLTTQTERMHPSPIQP